MVSSALPWTAVPEDGVEGREQFAHASDERHFGWLSGRPQALVEGGDDGVVARGDESRHVEGLAHGDSAGGASRRARPRRGSDPTPSAGSEVEPSPSPPRKAGAQEQPHVAPACIPAFAQGCPGKEMRLQTYPGRLAFIVMAGLDLACPGNPRLSGDARKTWLPGTRPGMTTVKCNARRRDSRPVLLEISPDSPALSRRKRG